MKKITYLFVLFLIIQQSLAQDIDKSQVPEITKASKVDSNNRDAVTKAALNYIESIYNVDKTKLASVSKSLTKTGYYLSRKDSSWSLSPMTYEELEHTVETYNKKKLLPESAPKTVEILDIGERVANVKVYAIWGFDYLLMTKSDEGQWVIQQILWQSYTFPEHKEMVEKMMRKG